MRNLVQGCKKVDVYQGTKKKLKREVTRSVKSDFTFMSFSIVNVVHKHPTRQGKNVTFLQAV